VRVIPEVSTDPQQVLLSEVGPVLMVQSCDLLVIPILADKRLIELSRQKRLRVDFQDLANRLSEVIHMFFALAHHGDDQVVDSLHDF
jgi:hypothetical protein